MGNPPSIPDLPSITDLTNQMKQLAQSLAHGGGGKDLRMTPQAHQQYIKLITEFQQTLATQRNVAALLTDYGDVGNFISAVSTKDQLASITTQNAVTALDQYIALLDQFQNTVDAAFKKVQAQDNAT
jgi:hypothetical protein